MDLLGEVGLHQPSPYSRKAAPNGPRDGPHPPEHSYFADPDDLRDPEPGARSVARRRAEFAEGALDRLALGVASVDDRGFLFYANHAAERLFTRDDGLRLLLGRLTADEPVAAARLHEAFTAAAAGRSAPPRRMVRVPRSSGGLPYLVTVVPLAVASPGQPCALALVQDAELGRSSLPDQLSDLFGLTRAEAQLAAALAEGHSLKDIAEARAVKISTVRTQTQMVLDKAGVSRQAEFVALVACMPRVLTARNHA
jgi:DNA-binding CsgD family transcriptional regulator